MHPSALTAPSYVPSSKCTIGRPAAPSATDTVTKDYKICANRAPVADAAATVNGRSVTVDGSGSTDPDGDTLTFSWQCGNNTTATGENAVCNYTATQNGPFTITLTVTDEPDGCVAKTDTDTAVVNIGP